MSLLTYTKLFLKISFFIIFLAGVFFFLTTIDGKDRAAKKAKEDQIINLEKRIQELEKREK